MNYRHRFLVRAPLASTLAEGDVMDFIMWLGPFLIRWLAHIQNVSATGFTNRQLKAHSIEYRRKRAALQSQGEKP